MSINQLQVEEINKNISYEEGKIYYKFGKNVTSKLWERLYKTGWIMTSHKGLVNIYDANNNKVVIEIGRINALKALSDLMR